MQWYKMHAPFGHRCAKQSDVYIYIQVKNVGLRWVSTRHHKDQTFSLSLHNRSGDNPQHTSSQVKILVLISGTETWKANDFVLFSIQT